MKEMDTVRKYLLNDTELKILLDNKPYIFLVDKPENEKFEKIDPYIVYFYKPISNGYIKDYQIEFRIIGKDLLKLGKVQQRLITLLDSPREKLNIRDGDTIIRHTNLLNGGGQIKNPNTGNFEIVLFFLCKF